MACPSPPQGPPEMCCSWPHVSRLGMARPGRLTAEIGSWLLFDRYIIPAALDLFTKQHAEPQKALRKREGAETRGV